MLGIFAASAMSLAQLALAWKLSEMASAPWYAPAIPCCCSFLQLTFAVSPLPVKDTIVAVAGALKGALPWGK